MQISCNTHGRTGIEGILVCPHCYDNRMEELMMLRKTYKSELFKEFVNDIHRVIKKNENNIDLKLATDIRKVIEKWINKAEG